MSQPNSAYTPIKLNCKHTHTTVKFWQARIAAAMSLMHLPSLFRQQPRSAVSTPVSGPLPVSVPSSQTVRSRRPRRPRSDTYAGLLLILFSIIVLVYYHPPSPCTSTFLFPTTTTSTSSSSSLPSPALSSALHVHVRASAVAYGNAAAITNSSSSKWWIGHFIPPSHPLRHNTHVETKWAVHPQRRSRPGGFVKNNIATSMAVLVSGKHRILFQHPRASVTLSNPGDYVIWGPNVLHSWIVLVNHTTVLTIRWPSIPNDRN